MPDRLPIGGFGDKPRVTIKILSYADLNIMSVTKLENSKDHELIGNQCVSIDSQDSINFLLKGETNN